MKVDTGLTTQQIEDFIELGYVRVDHAFPRAVADECRHILWKATQLDPEKPETWTQPVIRIGEIGLEPFRKAANTDSLHQAFDQLVHDNWLPRMSLGTFPIRFPSPEPASDTGWHVDASFAGENPGNYLEWRINRNSKGRALLMLFLFSDVTQRDAPTLIREGSHRDVAKLLEPEGKKGLSFMELAQKLDALPSRREVLATGEAGTVYLCHPLLAHAAQDHRGTLPKFMAQPPLLTKTDFRLDQEYALLCPVERAIVDGFKYGTFF
ncbi:phytanoyl-CoA dioxygenase family protein [Salmonirosea aquatica]|uniref:Phytanoyl-CoA dioxygenase n=1 Tax=Salmonirosea aquatica TaxID=2654236 RepID=A0A7C9FEP5_9BACT|nr:phytanoyl-CoA dioxygenase [Cytophagaceae bacterium SJW1-29]